MCLACLAWLVVAACATRSGEGGGAAKGNAAAARPAVSVGVPRPATAMRCGTQAIEVRRISDELALTVGARQFMLQPQRSASGARWASQAHPGTALWLKDDRGTLLLDGKAYPECVTVGPALSPRAHQLGP